MITVDTEGDNSWSRPKAITTRNAEFLQPFQILCESYGFKPTYLANYEMARCQAFREFGRDVLKREAGEIGMHLHAWYSPPQFALTDDDLQFHPYLTEYPRHVMEEKISFMTDLLEDTFGEKMISHRAGRWGFNETYAQILVEKGYRVDCSVTPYISWRHHRGDPRREGGADYSRFPDQVYFVDLEDISRSGDSPLLEVPVTILPAAWPSLELLRRRLKDSLLGSRVVEWVFPTSPPTWFRAKKGDLNDLLRVVKQAISEKRGYIEFMLHSSELMPGGSPRFPTEKDVENLYHDLKTLFEGISQRFVGATLKEYYQSFRRHTGNE